MVRAPYAPMYIAATDGSPQSDAAVDFAARMAQLDHASLTILTVEALGPAHPTAAPTAATARPPGPSSEAPDSDEILLKARLRAKALGVLSTGVALPPQEPASAVVRFAASAKASLIFVGSHGRLGLERTLLGSVAERIVRRSPCSVVVVR